MSLLSDLEKWLRASWPTFGLGTLPAETWLRIGLIPGSAGGWRSVGLVWRGGDGGPAVVVKFPRDATDNERVRAEPAALRIIDGWPLPRPARTAGSLGCTMVGERLVAAETAMPGHPLLAGLGAPRCALTALARLDDLRRWITAVASASSRPCTDDENSEWIIRALREPGLAGLSARETETLAALSEQAGRLLRRSPLPAVFTHNDMGPPNILVDRRGRFTALVDWESASWGLPMADLVYFVTRVAEESGYLDVTGAATGDDLSNKYARAARRWLLDTCAELTIDVDWLPVITAVTWLHHATNEDARSAAARDRDGMSRHRLRRFLAAAPEVMAR